MQLTAAAAAARHTLPIAFACLGTRLLLLQYLLYVFWTLLLYRFKPCCYSYV
jgi:hypothetical protein